VHSVPSIHAPIKGVWMDGQMHQGMDDKANQPLTKGFPYRIATVS
jgi:hypothetical protein